MVDTFHWALGDGSPAGLKACDPTRIAVVHVNDAPSADLRRLGDEDRVLPGEGVLPVAPFYGALARSS